MLALGIPLILALIPSVGSHQFGSPCPANPAAMIRGMGSPATVDEFSLTYSPTTQVLTLQGPSHPIIGLHLEARHIPNGQTFDPSDTTPTRLGTLHPETSDMKSVCDDNLALSHTSSWRDGTHQVPLRFWFEHEQGLDGEVWFMAYVVVKNAGKTMWERVETNGTLNVSAVGRPSWVSALKDVRPKPPVSGPSEDGSTNVSGTGNSDGEGSATGNSDGDSSAAPGDSSAAGGLGCRLAASLLVFILATM